MKRILLLLLLLSSSSFAQERSNAWDSHAMREIGLALTGGGSFGAPRKTTALLPTCATNQGGIAWDTTAGALKVCDGSSWLTLVTGSSGVTSITGTANQITASAATGAVTLSIPTNPTLPGTTTGTFSGNLTGAVTGNASTATALAANGTNCSAGSFPLGVDASGSSESCTALPTTIAGTANQITASGSTGAITLSIPSSPTLPGTTTGTFSGSLTGNASTASALSANQGTTITTLHGNAAGTAAFAVVTPSDAAGNTSGSGNFALVTSPTFTSPSLGTSYLSTTKTAGAAGTTAGLLVKIGTDGNVTDLGTSDTTGALGVAISTAASTVSLQVATRGIVNCVADNTTTIGDILGVGTTTGGRCKDLAQTVSTSVSSSLQVVGKALTAVAAGSNVSVQLYGPGHYGAQPNVTNATGTTPVANGGTGLTAGTSGGVPYYSAAGTIASSGALTANTYVKGGGAGATPAPGITTDDGSTVTVVGGTQASLVSPFAVSQTFNNSGTFPGVTLTFVETSAGASSKYFEILGGASGTTSELKIVKGGVTTFLNDVLTGGSMQVGASQKFRFSGRADIYSPAAAMISVDGITSSFPAWKRSGTGWISRLADDSADAPLKSSTMTISTTQTPASGDACTAGQITWDTGFIYVCTASGAWKRAVISGAGF